jgi:gliding motility-associated lipoprotein GldH
MYFINHDYSVRKIVLIIAVVSMLLSGCTTMDVFEKNNTIPKQEWKSDFASEGSFEISDTTAAYNVYVVLRHTDAYQYNNIWLNIGLQQPGDSIHFQKINLGLGSDANGWEGVGMDDIWEVRKRIPGSPFYFHNKGTYTFKLFQIMRDEPLKNIMSAGLRIVKIKK